MPRRVEDIIRTDRRSIRDVPADVSMSEDEKVPTKKARVVKPTLPQDIHAQKRRPSGGSRKTDGRMMWLFIVLGVVIIVGFTAFIASTRFSRATFTIRPVTIPIAVNNKTIVATGTSTPDSLRYEVIKYIEIASTSLPAMDGPMISTKASGSVTLYNSYSAAGQRLIAGTRFVGGSGLIYRLTGSVFIPGYAESNGSMLPGTLRTTIVADGAGAQYNLGKDAGSGELRIVAYKDGPRYDTVYAKLYTDVTGGFSGTKKTVNQKLLASTTENIQASLLKILRDKAMSSVPAGYVTYDNAYAISFVQPVLGGNTTKTANVSITSTLYSVVFKKSELIAKLAGSQNVDRFGKSSFSTDGLEKLQFTITNPGTFRAAKGNTLIARLNGNIELKGIIPIDELKHKLAGLPLTDTRAIFGAYSSVIDVTKSLGELFPSWASSVPKDENRISVIVGN